MPLPLMPLRTMLPAPATLLAGRPAHFSQGHSVRIKELLFDSSGDTNSAMQLVGVVRLNVSEFQTFCWTKHSHS